MLSLIDDIALADRISRREWLRVGGLSAVGLTLPALLRASERPSSPGATPHLAADLGSTFGKAKNCIFLWLQGGPPQHETFDPRSEEHTSELQSLRHLVCRLLLEKKKKKQKIKKKKTKKKPKNSTSIQNHK